MSGYGGDVTRHGLFKVMDSSCILPCGPVGHAEMAVRGWRLLVAVRRLFRGV